MDPARSSSQLQAWCSDFGRAYTDRHICSACEMDAQLGRYFGGVRKSEIFRRFIPADVLGRGRVLEVGCNIGLQLKILQLVHPGLKLYGLEPQGYAIDRGRAAFGDVHFVKGSGVALPFEDGAFDVVMTNGVLIHIAPADLPMVLHELRRCTARHVFFHEYYAASPTALSYRGRRGLLWKMNYRNAFVETCSDLKVVREELLSYPDPDGGADLTDQICLLHKPA